MNTLNSHDIEALILELNHASTPQEAIAAIHALAASGTQEVVAINALIAALSHHHPSVGAAAVAVLIELAPASVQPLITAFDASRDQGLQARIIQALAQIGDLRAFDLLAEVMGTTVANHCQGNVRRIATRGIGKIGSNSRNTEMIRCIEEKLTWALLTPEDWGLRYASAVSLQEIATQQAQAALEQAIAQEVDQVVRSRITLALEVLQTAAT
ncbi:HEAT repeat domain-containing protein [Nodularia sp. NIES-3585]|uniref:HEAT repeat domain-containing protein n=1 Tax=Nodularia sp. NIES-3585 TaxID=1973477 RepID=UPI000B5CEAD4|nr:HEAT repeat domain-containing protein [Nodularia sp. NIES-3585]GAX36569.1 bilin biosynthesis protein PecF [Nodularia sp. NIES-3585]